MIDVAVAGDQPLRMQLGVFGRTDDPMVKHTIEVAAALGHGASVFPLAQMAAGVPVAADLSGAGGASWLYAGDEIEACDAFVLRSYPAVHAILGNDTEVLPADAWFARGQLQAERSSFAQSVLLDLEARNKPMVNPHGATSPYDHKALQLSVFRRAGIPIPDTLITNHAESARLFIDALKDDGRDAIVKPSGGGAETRLVDDALRAKLDQIVSSPVIVQALAPGDDIRVTVVAGRVVSSVAIASSTLDYRSGSAYRTGGAVYVPHVLPSEVVAMCTHAASLCGHILSGIDLKHDEGRYLLLEANSAPVYLDIERKTGAEITREIVQWLARGAGGAR